MANFISSIISRRGIKVHRLGHSGANATVQSWEGGVKIQAIRQGDENIFIIYACDGSNGSEAREITRFSEHQLHNFARAAAEVARPRLSFH